MILHSLCTIYLIAPNKVNTLQEYFYFYHIHLWKWVTYVTYDLGPTAHIEWDGISCLVFKTVSGFSDSIPLDRAVSWCDCVLFTMTLRWSRQWVCWNMRPGGCVGRTVTPPQRLLPQRQDGHRQWTPLEKQKTWTPNDVMEQPPHWPWWCHHGNL